MPPGLNQNINTTKKEQALPPQAYQNVMSVFDKYNGNS